MKILVLGASRGTGALAVKVALDRGHDVTAFARSPDKLALTHPQLIKRKGDFHDRASVDAAVKDHDAVIVTASVSSPGEFKSDPTYFSRGTGFAVDAMKAHGVKRIVILSALGTGDSLPLMPWAFRKLLVGWLLRGAYEDHERQEALVRDSDLGWVIARPGRLTNGPPRGKYVARTAPDPVPNGISRADVADFLVKAADTDTWLHQAVQLGG